MRRGLGCETSLEHPRVSDGKEGPPGDLWPQLAPCAPSASPSFPSQTVEWRTRPWLEEEARAGGGAERSWNPSGLGLALQSQFCPPCALVSVGCGAMAPRPWFSRQVRAAPGWVGPAATWRCILALYRGWVCRSEGTANVAFPGTASSGFSRSRQTRDLRKPELKTPSHMASERAVEAGNPSGGALHRDASGEWGLRSLPGKAVGEMGEVARVAAPRKGCWLFLPPLGEG